VRLATDIFIAWRYLKPKRDAVSVITCISIIGVILGVAVMIVVIAVMAGFTDEFKKTILETDAHIQIYDYGRGYIEDPDAVMAAVGKIDGAKAAPVTQHSILAQCGTRFKPKIIFGIDPAKTAACVDLKKALKYGEFSLKPGEAMVSGEVANELLLHIGSRLVLHSPTKLAEMIDVGPNGKITMAANARTYLPGEFTVKGVFSFNNYKFDQSAIFVNIDDANELLGLPLGSANTVYARVEDPFHMTSEMETLQSKLPGMTVLSWKQMNRQFLGVLEVEKNMQFFLLIFIVLVAAFSITNTLITVVVQKTREIGLLKALGAGNMTVLMIFLAQGLIVGILGTFFGTALGLAVIHWRNGILDIVRKLSGQDIFPKQFYLFSQLPASVHIGDLVIIALASIFLCTLGGLIPAWRAARLDPAKALRYE